MHRRVQIQTGSTMNQLRSGFTLLEILVVVAIISILVGITTMVGTAVINSGKKQSALGIIGSLDEALAAYIDVKGEVPPALVEVPYAQVPSQIQGDLGGAGDDGVEPSAYYPAIDGRARDDLASDLTEVNSVGLFIQSARVVPRVDEIINSINPKFVQNYSADEDFQPFLLTVFDPWGNPMRYVHPKFDGIIERERRTLGDAGEPVNTVNPNKPFYTRGALPANATSTVRLKFIRRNRLLDIDYGGDGPAGGTTPAALSDYDLLPDSDGGKAVGNRPYFYSAGPDGDPSTIDDNIYLKTPQLVDPGVS
jgi:prepilin-type N-terminal cleavage/methylation domain-containing protein